MSQGGVVLYAILPYVAITIFVVGTFWRYRRDQYGWTARSTQILESRYLRYGSTLFHLGVLAAIGGHVLGILVPRSFTAAVGVSDDFYHVIAIIGGVTAGGAVLAGFLILVYRRWRFPRVRVTTTRMDVAVFGMLAFGIITGLLATLTNLGDSVAYRETVAPYFRQLFIFDPQPDLMTGGGVSLIFQIHVVSVWFLYALWPFSRLVHVWSIPVDWLVRSHILYRGRTARPHRRRQEPAPARMNR